MTNRTSRKYYGHDFPNCSSFEEFVAELIFEKVADFMYEREEDCVLVYNIYNHPYEYVDEIAESHGWKNEEEEAP